MAASAIALKPYARPDSFDKNAQDEAAKLALNIYSQCVDQAKEAARQLDSSDSPLGWPDDEPKAILNYRLAWHRGRDEVTCEKARGILAHDGNNMKAIIVGYISVGSLALLEEARNDARDKISQAPLRNRPIFEALNAACEYLETIPAAKSAPQPVSETETSSQAAENTDDANQSLDDLFGRALEKAKAMKPTKAPQPARLVHYVAA